MSARGYSEQAHDLGFKNWKPIARDWTHRDEHEYEPTQREVDLMPLRFVIFNGLEGGFNGWAVR